MASRSKFGIFKSSASSSHPPSSSFEALPNSPNANTSITTSTPTPTHRNNAGTQDIGYTLNQINNRINGLENSIANIAADVSELKTIRDDVDKILKLLEKNSGSNQTVSSISSNHQVLSSGSHVPTSSPQPPPKPRHQLGKFNESNLQLDIGTSGPEEVEIQLDDEVFPHATQAFREYVLGLMNEAKGGLGSNEYQVELLVWNKTYAYIDGWFMGDIDNLRPNYSDDRYQSKKWSICIWGPKSGSTDSTSGLSTFSIEQVLISEEPISEVIGAGNLSGDWIIIGSIVSGQEHFKAMLEKGSNKKGFLSFKSP